jgi:radical SAM/Cys-rich protein
VPSLVSRDHPLAPAAEQRSLLARLPLAATFESKLSGAGLDPLRARKIDTLQVNVGKLCNQTCAHCHVDAGPDRREVMPDRVVDACLSVLARTKIPTLDVTGGAPELHPRFREIVARAAELGRRVLHRCNLTAILLPAYEDVPELLARHRVEIVASLPYFLAKQTDAQRGQGVFEKSLEALRRLNAIGYGKGSGLVLVLVTNPVGAFLPAKQQALEADWRRELRRRYAIEFDHLYTITNMPISRFLEYLEQSGNLEGYMDRLVNAFNPAAAAGVMCRDLVSVGWDGTLYDCDFNQMLELPLKSGLPRTIFDFEESVLAGREIVTGPHCFGCTAGAGSSCGGQVAS